MALHIETVLALFIYLFLGHAASMFCKSRLPECKASNGAVSLSGRIDLSCCNLMQEKEPGY